jgi:hypothetical protein
MVGGCLLGINEIGTGWGHGWYRREKAFEKSKTYDSSQEKAHKEKPF